MTRLPPRVTDLIAASFGVLRIDLLGPARHAKLVEARNVAMYLLREKGWTFEQVGALFDRAASTAMRSHRIVENRAIANRAFRLHLEALQREIAAWKAAA